MPKKNIQVAGWDQVFDNGKPRVYTGGLCLNYTFFLYSGNDPFKIELNNLML